MLRLEPGWRLAVDGEVGGHDVGELDLVEPLPVVLVEVAHLQLRPAALPTAGAAGCVALAAVVAAALARAANARTTASRAVAGSPLFSRQPLWAPPPATPSCSDSSPLRLGGLSSSEELSSLLPELWPEPCARGRARRPREAAAPRRRGRAVIIPWLLLLSCRRNTLHPSRGRRHGLCLSEARSWHGRQ